jgi:hypothetical protein
VTSFFVPSSYPPIARASARRPAARRPAVRRHEVPALTFCVLAVVLLLEAAVHFAPHALVLSPVQGTHLFKMVSGYSMFCLLAFAMGFGWLRRLPAMSGHHRLLNEIHQLAGLLILVLLASHIGQKPVGFLLVMFHAMAISLGAGALRGVLGPKIGRRGSTALLALHIGLSCLVAAAVLLHLYFVYAYTA